jgi:hypothetical protein
VNSSTATPTYSHAATDQRFCGTPEEPATPQKWSIVVNLARDGGTTALLKVLSTLHVRHAQVSHLQFTTAPDRSGVLTIECSVAVASIETVRKSIERAVHVVSATVHETPSQNGRFARDTPGGSRMR